MVSDPQTLPQRPSALKPFHEVAEGLLVSGDAAALRSRLETWLLALPKPGRPVTSDVGSVALDGGFRQV